MNGEILKGEVYYADLSPVLHSEQGGIRPVLIIQNNYGNKFSPTTIVAAITSQARKAKIPTHVPLSKADFPFLKSDSVILCEQIRTIDTKRLRDYRGKVDDYTMYQVMAALENSFGMHA